jgi:electron transport complex protein RnfG
MNVLLQHALRTSLILLLFALIGTALMAYTYRHTEPIIEKSRQEEKLRLINQVLPRQLYDNNLLSTYRELPPDDLLGTRKSSGMWLATKAGQPVAVVLEAIAPEGYGGDIDLLIGIDANNTLTGVRVVQHKETPGLGDYIQLSKSPWILQFAGKSYNADEDSRWKVKKDGGEFDSRAGATITPRAIVKAVREALKYFQQHRDELLLPSGIPQI